MDEGVFGLGMPEVYGKVDAVNIDGRPYFAKPSIDDGL